MTYNVARRDFESSGAAEARFMPPMRVCAARHVPDTSHSKLHLHKLQLLLHEQLWDPQLWLRGSRSRAKCAHGAAWTPSLPLTPLLSVVLAVQTGILFSLLHTAVHFIPPFQNICYLAAQHDLPFHTLVISCRLHFVRLMLSIDRHQFRLAAGLVACLWANQNTRECGKKSFRSTCLRTNIAEHSSRKSNIAPGYHLPLFGCNYCGFLEL